MGKKVKVNQAKFNNFDVLNASSEDEKASNVCLLNK